MSDLDTAELRALLAKATPRPWRTYEQGRDDGADYETHISIETGDKDADWVVSGEWPNNHRNDPALIVAAVNALPKLLDIADAVRSGNLDLAREIAGA